MTAGEEPGPARGPREAGATVAWASDIHFDHASPAVITAFVESLRSSGAAAVLLGGDIGVAADIDVTVVGLAEMTGLPVHFVLGNHDYYGGSVREVRGRLAALKHPGVHWLPCTGPRELAAGVTLVGHGGWGDARVGDFAGSDVILNDYVAIAELSRVFDVPAFAGVFGAGTALEAELNRLGQEAADTLAPHLREAAASRQVVVLTHVPPFREACWYEGRISDEKFLPGFTCGAVGEVLRRVAAEHPACGFTVLCGHTHSGGVVRIAHNLVVHTQGAAYEKPDFALLVVAADTVRVLDRP